MRIRYNILIIVFVLSSLFIIKDDIKNIYVKGLSYINDDLKSSTIKNIESDSSQYVTNMTDSSIKSPGPLRVVEDLLTSNSNKTKLSYSNIINLTNKSRLENGSLPPLTENLNLNVSASKKLEDMFSKQYFEHISPSGVGVGDLADQSSYEYLIIGENLAMGNFKDDQSLVTAWMNSPGHRANILNKHYGEIGVAVGKGMFEGRSVWIAVQHFGLSKDVCSPVSEVLHGIIQATQEEIKDTENDLILRRSKIDKGVLNEGVSIFEQIKKYNDMIFYYNQMIKDLKQKISEYNTQVEEFNSCLIKNTTD